MKLPPHAIGRPRLWAAVSGARWLSACGPLRTFALEALPSGFGGAPICRVPARRPGNFHLRPQMKVTKAKGLNATPLGSFFALGWIGPAGHLDTPQ